MLTHAAFIRAAGGVFAVRQLLKAKLGMDLRKQTVQAWVERDSIPPYYWGMLEEIGVATQRQLYLTSPRKLQPPPTKLASGA